MSRGAATAGQLRQAIERGSRAAEMIDQRAKGARSNILGTDQPQPVDALGVGEIGAGADGVHGGSLGQAQNGATGARGEGAIHSGNPALVVAGLVPAIHVLLSLRAK